MNEIKSIINKMCDRKKKTLIFENCILVPKPNCHLILKVPVKNFDEYLSYQPEPVKLTLEKLRQTIHSVAPDAVEVISYGMPAFKYQGMLVGFAAFKNHCSLFPWNSSTIGAFVKELKNYSVSKGTIRFTIDKPISASLVKKIVKFRLQQNLDK